MQVWGVGVLEPIAPERSLTQSVTRNIGRAIGQCAPCAATAIGVPKNTPHDHLEADGGERQAEQREEGKHRVYAAGHCRRAGDPDQRKCTKDQTEGRFEWQQIGPDDSGIGAALPEEVFAVIQNAVPASLGVFMSGSRVSGNVSLPGLSR